MVHHLNFKRSHIWICMKAATAQPRDNINTLVITNKILTVYMFTYIYSIAKIRLKEIWKFRIKLNLKEYIQYHLKTLCTSKHLTSWTIILISTKLWAAGWQNQQNDLCAHRRLRSAWASAQSDQSLYCPHEDTWSPELPNERTAKTLIWVFAGCTSHFGRFCHVQDHIITSRQQLYTYLSSVKHHTLNWHNMSHVMRKSVLRCMRTTTVQISLSIIAAWSAPLLFTA